jgi:hypothetical protein
MLYNGAPHVICLEFPFDKHSHPNYYIKGLYIEKQKVLLVFISNLQCRSITNKKLDWKKIQINTIVFVQNISFAQKAMENSIF